MGLDMYLEARFPLPAYDERLSPVREVIGGAISYAPPQKKPGDDPTLLEVTGVSVRAGYWRKLDPLHRWFVDRTQDGHDDGRPAYVSPETLVTLEQQLEQVSDDPASVSACFLVEDDEALDASDIAYTLEIVARAQRLQVRGWDIYYHASW